jgi:hypothetical protein
MPPVTEPSSKFLKDFQIGISAAPAKKYFDLSQVEVRLFNSRMDSLSHFILLCLGRWNCGEVKKIAVTFHQNDLPLEFDPLGDILIVQVPATADLFARNDDEARLCFFDLALATLRAAAAKYCFPMEPIQNLERQRQKALLPHRFAFGKAATSKDRRHKAQGYVEYGREDVRIFAQVENTKDKSSREIDLWKSKPLETNWRTFCNHLGTIVWSSTTTFILKGRGTLGKKIAIEATVGIVLH